MKGIVILFCAICQVAVAQRPLSITTNKTTSLIFPFAITHVDRGTTDVLVQPVKDNGKILLVKAAVQQFKETNLSVVTEDGNVYSFTVRYNEQPDGFIYELPAGHKTTVATYAKGILDNKGTVKGIHDKSWNIEASIIGIYIKDKVIYYQLLLCNNSAIDYDIDVLRFYIRDKQRSRRTAVQENDCTPLYIAGNDKQIKAYNFSIVAIALEKFTIPDAKVLCVQIMEKNGGRHLQLRVGNSKIVKAVMLPDLY